MEKDINNNFSKLIAKISIISNIFSLIKIMREDCFKYHFNEKIIFNHIYFNEHRLLFIEICKLFEKWNNKKGIFNIYSWFTDNDKYDTSKIHNFIIENNEIIKKLRYIRNKTIAHNDFESSMIDINIIYAKNKISYEKLENFILDIFKLIQDVTNNEYILTTQMLSWKLERSLRKDLLNYLPTY
jgi:hypothetical protein